MKLISLRVRKKSSERGIGENSAESSRTICESDVQTYLLYLLTY